MAHFSAGTSHIGEHRNILPQSRPLDGRVSSVSRSTSLLAGFLHISAKEKATNTTCGNPTQPRQQPPSFQNPELLLKQRSNRPDYSLLKNCRLQAARPSLCYFSHSSRFVY